MSYLTSPTLNSFSKAVISFWFRVPQASLDAAQAEFDSSNPSPLLGLIPLVVFGQEGTSAVTANASNQSEPFTETTAVHTCVEKADGGTFNGNAAVAGSTFVGTAWSECTDSSSTRTYYKSTTTYSAVPGQSTNPSYVAIDGNGNLQINFESTQTGNVVLAYGLTSVTDAYYTQDVVSECFTFPSIGYCGDYTQVVVSDGGFAGILEMVFALIGWRLSTAVADYVVIDTGSSPREDHPRSVTYGPVPGDVGTGAFNFFLPTNFNANTWHHILISVDMTGGSASTGVAFGGDASFAGAVSRITQTSTMYVAVDDVNYPTGGNLFPGTNKVVTGSAQTIAFSGQSVDFSTKPPTPQGPIPSYSIGSMSVPAAPLGIPSVGKYVDKVLQVEMAEFQMWTGVTLDTSVESNRRLFISSKGRPTDPSITSEVLSTMAIGDPSTWQDGADIFVPPVVPNNPANTAIRNKKLGKPVISFTRSDQTWIRGQNLGTLKGKVTKTGKIKSYRPDPQLGK